MAGALHERYHDTVILLHTVDRLSPRTLADRFGAGVEEVRAILIAAGALDTSAMRQSNVPPPRQGRPFGTSIQYADPEEREAADIRHVNTVIRTLGGRGFPFLNFGAAQMASADPAKINRIMAAISGLVPLDDGSHWAPAYAPKWPQDYSKSEVALRRAIATAAVLAAEANP